MKQFIVDAFTDIVFKGNPAAVCLVEQPLTDEQMQLIAIENNLSETAFVQAAADGNGFDCVSRSFAPKLAILEDPVCGSGHCHIFPYWAKKLGQSKFVGYQASKRSGVVYGEVDGDTVKLTGQAVLFSKGEIFV